MTDADALRELIETFYRQQYEGAQSRISRGGPVCDIYSALAAIRSALPPVPPSTSIADWLPHAINSLKIARQDFRMSEEDSAGWGSATIQEIIDALDSFELGFRERQAPC